jgi:DivIVA domain-containing protein
VTLLFVLLALGVVGVVAAVAAGLITGGLDAPSSSMPSPGLPAGDLAVSELDDLRFDQGLRGYRMDQVDAAMDRLREEVVRRDGEIADLREELLRSRETSVWHAQQAGYDGAAGYVPGAAAGHDGGYLEPPRHVPESVLDQHAGHDLRRARQRRGYDQPTGDGPAQ